MRGWLIAGGAEGVYAGKPQLCSHKCKDCSNKGREESEGEVRSVLLRPQSNVNLKDTEKCCSLVYYSGSVQVSYYCFSSEMEEAPIACACILGMGKKEMYTEFFNR